jgi:hypothetical protein
LLPAQHALHVFQLSLSGVQRRHSIVAHALQLCCFGTRSVRLAPQLQALLLGLQQALPQLLSMLLRGAAGAGATRLKLCCQPGPQLRQLCVLSLPPLHIGRR